MVQIFLMYSLYVAAYLLFQNFHLKIDVIKYYISLHLYIRFRMSLI